MNLKGFFEANRNKEEWQQNKQHVTRHAPCFSILSLFIRSDPGGKKTFELQMTSVAFTGRCSIGAHNGIS